jgi:energy-coupling factor transporter ATP-binding protein EcfA2
MKIQKFSFSHNGEHWHIDEVKFDDFNLLVGLSGSGKTRILKALELIFNVASNGGYKLDNVKWNITFIHLSKKYTWILESRSATKFTAMEFRAEKENPFPFVLPCEIIHEELIRHDSDNDVKMIFRHTDGQDSKTQIDGKEVPRFNPTESAITVFSEDSFISTVSQAFKKLVSNEISQKQMTDISADDFDKLSSRSITDYFEYQYEKSIWGSISPIKKVLLLQKFEDSIFQDIKDNYIDIFPSVEDIRVSSKKNTNEKYNLFFEIKENDSQNWIPQDRISSGMFHTLVYLIEVIAAPEGSIILIDEFENSLGVNCMPELTDCILDYSEGKQFIITSHHPYIIDNIPWQDWQIVSRKGNHIRTTKATDIPDLDTASRLDKFTQLINVLDY